MNNEVAIIGGGAAGMMAAISAGRNDKEVTLFEKNDKLGKKILLTGNGRCNITNRYVSWENYHGQSPKFTASVFSRFSYNDTLQFFTDLGLVLVEEDNGRMFPRSQQAQSVVEVLEQELENTNCEVLTDRKIRKINDKDGKFEIETDRGKIYTFDKVIIATGGRSYPNTGSTGDGYQFARDIGHTVTRIFPASTPLRISHFVCNKLQGVKVDVVLSILENEKVIFETEDELLFTHLGLSAPAVLQASRTVAERIYNKDINVKLTCEINFFPEYSQEEVFNLLKERITNHPDRKICNQFIGILPKRLAPTIFKDAEINSDKKSSQVSNNLLHNIVKLLTQYHLPIHDVLGWKSAQFTAGGVDVKEIDSTTMESKLVPGLFFCGEVVDIDGESGGYNLQWAWSSGYLAGQSC